MLTAITAALADRAARELDQGRGATAAARASFRASLDLWLDLEWNALRAIDGPRPEELRRRLKRRSPKLLRLRVVLMHSYMTSQAELLRADIFIKWNAHRPERTFRSMRRTNRYSATHAKQSNPETAAAGKAASA